MYLFIDTETGGLEPSKYSLLSVGLILTNDKFEVVDKLELFTIPDDGVFQVSPRAMEINKIRLDNGVVRFTYKEAEQAIHNFVNKHTVYFDPSVGNFRATKPKLVGHNLPFDLSFLAKLMPEDTMRRSFDMDYMDTKRMVTVEKEKGKIPKDVSSSLSVISKHFNLSTENNYHNALFDAELTRLLLIKLLSL